jgi:hypothetical protein
MRRNGPSNHRAEADFGERLAVGDMAQAHRVLVYSHVFVVEAVRLGIQIARDQREERLLERADAIGAAHRESEHERLVLRQQSAPQQDVQVVVRAQIGGAGEDLDPGTSKRGFSTSCTRSGTSRCFSAIEVSDP